MKTNSTDGNEQNDSVSLCLYHSCVFPENSSFTLCKFSETDIKGLWCVRVQQTEFYFCEPCVEIEPVILLCFIWKGISVAILKRNELITPKPEIHVSNKKQVGTRTTDKACSCWIIFYFCISLNIILLLLLLLLLLSSSSSCFTCVEK